LEHTRELIKGSYSTIAGDVWKILEMHAFMCEVPSNSIQNYKAWISMMAFVLGVGNFTDLHSESTDEGTMLTI